MKELLEIVGSIFKSALNNGDRDTFRRNFIYLSKVNRFALDALDTYNVPKVQEISNLIASINSSTFLTTEEKKVLLYAVLRIKIIAPGESDEPRTVETKADPLEKL
jgi:hypothetical protein